MRNTQQNPQRKSGTERKRSARSPNPALARVEELGRALSARWATASQRLQTWSSGLRVSGFKFSQSQAAPLSKKGRSESSRRSEHKRAPSTPAAETPQRAAAPYRRPTPRLSPEREPSGTAAEGRPAASQAYRLAPGRRQIQQVGWFFLVLIGAWLVGGFYLNISSRTATLGRQIQEMQVRFDGSRSLVEEAMIFGDPVAQALTANEIIPLEELRIQVVDLKNQLAMLTSIEQMEQRARALGFEPADPAAIVYLPVTHYQPAALAQLAPPIAPQVSAAHSTPDYFSENLWDVLAKGWRSLAAAAAENPFEGLIPTTVPPVPEGAANQGQPGGVDP